MATFMDIFTLITGVASLIGFFIQVFDLFPKFGKLRQPLFFLFLGFFLGSLIRTFDSSSIKFAIEITFLTGMIAFVTLITLSLLVGAAFTNDWKRRGELHATAGLSFGLLLILLFAKAISSAPDSGWNRVQLEKAQLSVQELNYLVERAAEEKNYERAVMHLEEIKSRFDANDTSAIEAINKRILDLKQKEVQ